MKLGLGQSARMEQRLVQSPQMIQAMQILQLSHLDLTARVEQELMENPFLEREEGSAETPEEGAGDEGAGRERAGAEAGDGEPSLRDTIADEFERMRANEELGFRRRLDREASDRKAEAMANTPDRPRSLAAALIEEIALIDFDEHERDLAEFLIYSLDGRGFLTDSLEELADRIEPGLFAAPVDAPSTLDEQPEAPDAETPLAAPDTSAGQPSLAPEVVERTSDEVTSEEVTADPQPAEPDVDGSERDVESTPEPPVSPRVRQLEHIVSRIRAATHPGLFAHDLRDCLLLQLDAAGEEDVLVYQLVDEHLEDITKNRLPHIAKSTGRDIEDIKLAIETLRELDPSPGREYGDELAATLNPDLIVEEYGAELGARGEPEVIVRLARERALGLQVSPGSPELLAGLDRAAQEARGRDEAEAEQAPNGHVQPETEPSPPESEAARDEEHLDDAEAARRWARRKLESARWLIDAVEQRRSTMLRIAEAVFRHQRRFLAEGPKGLQPLRMQEIADETGVHISTVSRAVAGKYVQTPRGIFPLKYFFTSGTTDESGGKQSQVSIQQRLAELIEAEDKQNPLSDDQLAAELAKRDGIKIARRTVTKYRKALSIPSSSQRKQF